MEFGAFLKTFEGMRGLLPYFLTQKFVKIYIILTIALFSVHSAVFHISGHFVYYNVIVSLINFQKFVKNDKKY